MPRRIGVFGGTFDPVHYGHLILAEQCREQVGLDEVWFLPAGQPPHKERQPITPSRQRCDMLQLAISGTQAFVLQTLEVDRDGPSYTVETLSTLRETCPDNQFYLLVGADMLRDFPHWREPERIAALCSLVAVSRGERHDVLTDSATRIATQYGTEVTIVDMPTIDISSTDLRRRAAEGRSIRFLTPRGVELYIAAQGLYRS